MTEFFDTVGTIEYGGPESDGPPTFRWYRPDRVVGDRTMAEHLRFGACYRHSFTCDGFDVFGSTSGHEPQPVSGRQELLERLVVRHVDLVR